MLRRRLWSLLIGLSLTTTALADVKVEVRGLPEAETDNVKARLELPAGNLQDGLSRKEAERLLRHIEPQIRQSLQPFGWYSPVIRLALQPDGNHWRAVYTVDRGEPTLVRSVEAHFEDEGAKAPKLEEVRKGLPLAVGERLFHENYETAKKRMSDAAYAEGFLDARWRIKKLRVMVEARAAEIELRLDTGPRYFFGEVTVEQDSIRPSIMERYVPIQPGEPFDPQKLLDLQFAFSDLGYFQTVDIEPQREQAGADRRVPILVTTTPRARKRFDFGVGYGTDTRARASIGTQWRRLNSLGHTLNTDFQLSEIKNTLAADYRIPLGSKSGENLSFNTGVETEKLEDGDTFKYLIGTSLNRTPGKWKRRLYLEYSHEKSDFGTQIAIADLLTPGVSFTRSETNDPIHARRGWYIFLDTHGAQEGVLSNTGFLQGRTILRGAHPVGERGRVLARAELGASFVKEFKELPASQRFFAGGDQSVRGYAYQSLGPRDDDGKVVGGRYLSAFSVEGEYRVWNDVGAAIFVDTGGADNQPGPELSTGVGVGLRYRAPVGSLQIDLAHPLDDPDTTVRVHFGVRVGL